jgi:hypothetical protein
MNLEKTWHFFKFLTEMTFDRKFFWPKTFSKNGLLTESSFDRKHFSKMLIWPKAFFKKWSFDRMFFRKMIIWPKKFLTKGKTTLIHHYNRKSYSYFLGKVEWPCGQMTFRSNHHFSKKKTFGQMNFRSNDYFQLKLLVNKTFGQMNFRSNELLGNFFSVKWQILSKVDSPFDRKFILPKGHKTDFFSENVHLTFW